jgi:hypothetical protein
MGAIIESITSMSEGIVVIQELLVGSKKVAMIWTTLDYWKKFYKWTTGT